HTLQSPASYHASFYTDRPPILLFFFFNAPAPPAIYTLSLHDALPIYPHLMRGGGDVDELADEPRVDGVVHCVHSHVVVAVHRQADRKSTRLNSSHVAISYAVFCLKKKKKKKT